MARSSAVATPPGGLVSPGRVLTVRVGAECLALPLEDVTEILPALAFVPLPDAPPVIRGVVNLRGVPVPVLDLRTRLDLPVTAPDPDHHVVVTTIASRTVGLWVDRVESVVEIESDTLVPVTQVAAARHVQGVALLDDGVLLVHDVSSFLSADEALHLGRCLDETADR